jgi:Predicted transcriptional regulators
MVIKIGDRVRKLRDGLGITQHELATRAGVTPQTISRIERNVNDASIASLHKIAPVLGTSIDELVNGSNVSAETREGKKK